MSEAGQTTNSPGAPLDATADAIDAAATADARDAPRAMALLVMCGYEPAAAAGQVRRTLVGMVRDGLVGGSALGTELVVTALASAPAPVPARPPDGPVEAALDTLTWDDRRATVATVLLGTNRLGPGQPDQLAILLGARVPDWGPVADPDTPSLPDLLDAAAARRNPGPQPGMLAAARRAAARRIRRLVLLVAALLALLALAAGAITLVIAGGDERAGAPTAGSPRIIQWVAVLDTGPTVGSLAGQARALGPAVGPHVFTDRWACYTGFPANAVDDEWFLGIAANDRPLVDELVARTGRQPSVVARVSQVCLQAPPAGDGITVVP